MPATALGLALLAALATAVGMVLQSRSVRAVWDRSIGIVGLFARLLRTRSWWYGVALAGPVVGITHTAALRRGTLIGVEAVMVSSLVFALALGAMMTRRSVSRRDWRSAVMVVVGLTVFLSAADPHGDDYSVALGEWLLVGVAVLAMVALLVGVAWRTTRPNVRAVAWGTAAALLLGTSAMLLKYVSILLEDGLETVVTSPVLWILMAAELGALLCQQLAFRTGDFAAALAPIVGANPLIAGAIGVVVYHERFHHTVPELVIAATGLALVATGITTLAASPMVAAGAATNDSRSPRPSIAGTTATRSSTGSQRGI